MSKCEVIGAIIGALIGCTISAIFNVFVIQSIWFAVLTIIGYLMGGWIEKSIKKTAK